MNALIFIDFTRTFFFFLSAKIPPIFFGESADKKSETRADGTPSETFSWGVFGVCSNEFIRGTNDFFRF